MKLFTLICLFCFSVVGHADLLSTLLSNYEDTDMNGKCSVIYHEGQLKIEGSEVRQSFSVPIEHITPVAHMLLGTSTDYDGQAEVYFIPREYSLLIIGTWEDSDNDFDRSSFCELSLKK